MKKGKVFFFSGPSGVGKGTLISALKKKHTDWVFPPSCTTRTPRKGEKEGETYNFISKEKFREKIAAGDFLEWAQVHNDNFYGTLKEGIIKPIEQGKIVIREFDVQGFLAVKDKLPRENYVSIFISPIGGVDLLIRRIKKRDKNISEKELALRVKSMEKEFAHKHEYDEEIFSSDDNLEIFITFAEKVIQKNL